MKSPSPKSRVSPGRNGKSSPHSTKTMPRLIQNSALPNWSSSQLGSIQLMPRRKGWSSSSRVTRQRYPSGPDAPLAVRRGGTVPAVDDGQTERGAVRPDAARPGRGRASGPWPGAWPTGEQYDAQLLAEGDRRNVVDRYRYWSMEAIVADLDTRRHDFHVAIENWQHDFNIGTIVRSANAFLAAEVHIVGNRRWNRRGAMVTDRYQHVRHHPTADDLAAYLHERPGGPVALLGIDNLPGSQHLETMTVPRRVCFLFGQEGPGPVRRAHATSCDGTFSIAQFGSTRSINASAAAAIAMHAWVREHADLSGEDAWRG